MTARYVIGAARDQTGRGTMHYVYDRERFAQLDHDGRAVSGHAPNTAFTIEQARELVARLESEAGS